MPYADYDGCPCDTCQKLAAEEKIKQIERFHKIFRAIIICVAAVACVAIIGSTVVTISNACQRHHHYGVLKTWVISTPSEELRHDCKDIALEFEDGKKLFLGSDYMHYPPTTFEIGAAYHVAYDSYASGRKYILSAYKEE